MKRALLIGLDQYTNFGSLRGCVNDVHAIEPLLVELTRFSGHLILGVVPGKGGPDGSSSEVPRGVPS